MKINVIEVPEGGGPELERHVAENVSRAAGADGSTTCSTTPARWRSRPTTSTRSNSNAPAHRDTAFIRRFMTFFGPISSIFDFATDGIMIWVFNARAPLFRSGWFVESLATQSLIIFAIRTHRVPFFHSRPSTPLALATMICVAIGVLLPFSPLAHVLGFVALPASFLATLAVMIVIYLVLVELGKLRFYRARPHGPPVARRRPEREHWIHHRATRWSIPGRPRRPMLAHQP